MKQNADKKACVELAKLISKERANWTCEKCNKSKANGYTMHGAHIIPVTYARTAALPKNILCLCAACHSMGPNCAHEDRVGFGLWFNKKFGEKRYTDLKYMAMEYSKNPFPKIDWKLLRKELKDELASTGKDKKARGRKKSLPKKG